MKKDQRKKSVTFCFSSTMVHTIPRVSFEEWPLLYYEQDELAEFRYEAFTEECLYQDSMSSFLSASG